MMVVNESEMVNLWWFFCVLLVSLPSWARGGKWSILRRVL